MPHRLHVPGARQLDALEAQLGDPMDLGHRGVDVAIGQARQADVAVGIVAAELGQPRVVDAQHLVGGLAVVQLGRRGEDAVDHLGVDAVAIHLLDAQVRVARPADALLAVLVAGRSPPSRRPAAACRGRASSPRRPTPPASPNVAPLLATHRRPSGPSATYGMRSFMSRGRLRTRTGPVAARSGRGDSPPKSGCSA